MLICISPLSTNAWDSKSHRHVVLKGDVQISTSAPSELSSPMLGIASRIGHQLGVEEEGCHLQSWDEAGNPN